jgi:hypothetical protein
MSKHSPLTACSLKDIVTQTQRALTSRTAQRTLLRTILISTACTILYGLAAIAYVLFYNAYLPDQVTVLPIHLQYGYGPNPYGVSLLTNLKDHQAYDVSVSLTLPRSPSNVDRGNFMVALYLLDKPGTGGDSPSAVPSDQLQHTATHHRTDTVPTIAPPPDPRAYLSNRRTLHASHRAALIPYADPLASLASRLLFLPLRLVPFSPFSRLSSSSISITVPVVERASFPAGSIPSSLFLELQAGQSLRVAAASVTVTAQLSGLRWLMHRHHVASFVAGTSAFWACEVLFMAVAWAVLAQVVSPRRPASSEGGAKRLGPAGKERKAIAEGKKTEGGEGDMSDTERTFPTTSRAPPLKYESMKEEDVGGEAIAMAELPIAAGGVADDEDDGGPDEGWRDSGIGTSYSDAGAGPGSVRKRASGKGR